MNILLILLLETLIISTLTYLYLHKKTRISLKFLYIDNLAVVVLTFLIIFVITEFVHKDYQWLLFFITPIFVLGIAFSLTMVRFWRTPNRKIIANANELISPADGNVLYIKMIEKGEIPISIKKGLKAKLEEITQTNILEKPCWLI